MYYKNTAVYWIRRIYSYLFLICLSFATNIFTYNLLISRISDVTMKTCARGRWWVYSFIRMYNNHVSKILSSLLVKKNQFIFFSNVFELCSQYYRKIISSLLVERNPFIPFLKYVWSSQPTLLHTAFSFPYCETKSWKQTPKDTVESVASWGFPIILYQKYTAVFWLKRFYSYFFLMCTSSQLILLHNIFSFPDFKM